MKIYTFCVNIAALLIFLNKGYTYKIVMMPANIRSHIIPFSQLASALISRGHNVTMLLGSGMTIPADTVDDKIQVVKYNSPPPMVFDTPELINMIVSNAFNYSVLQRITILKHLRGLIDEETKGIMDNAFTENAKKLQFDFAVVDIPATVNLYYFLYKLKLPYAILGAECSYWDFKIPVIPSYVPNVFLTAYYSEEMNLLERTINTLFYTLFIIMSQLYPGPTEVAKHVPERPVVSFQEIVNNASLCLRLKQNIFESARPSVPNVINVAGLVIRPNGVLAPEITRFMKSSSNGVIVVSFGSWLDTIPKHVIDKMITAFNDLDFNIIWKMTGDINLYDFPKEKLLILPWLPQNDILAHPKVICFVTHCGINSVLEAIYHGVPMVGMPVAVDQPANAGAMESKGYMKKVDIVTFTASELTNAVMDVVNGPYRDNIKKASLIFKDLPPGEEVASFWIEHVIKHGDTHLKQYATKMPGYKYLLLDVAAVFLSMLCVSCFTCCCCCKCIYQRCYYNRTKPNNSNKDKRE